MPLANTLSRPVGADCKEKGVEVAAQQVAAGGGAAGSGAARGSGALEVAAREEAIQQEAAREPAREATVREATAREAAQEAAAMEPAASNWCCFPAHRRRPQGLKHRRGQRACFGKNDAGAPASVAATCSVQAHLRASASCSAHAIP